MIPLTRIAIFIFSLQFIIASASAQQQANDSLASTVNEIHTSNVYEMRYTLGYTGTVSKQYLRFKQLLQLATDEYLYKLAIKHNNAVVRLYAYHALKQKVANMPEDIAMYFANDHTVVKTLWGCYGGSQTVSMLAKQNLIFAPDVKKLNIKQ